MRNKILAAGMAAIISAFSVQALDAAPLLMAPSGDVSNNHYAADVVFVRSSKAFQAKREVADPGDELIGPAGTNGDELIGRVEDDRYQTQGGGQQVMGLIGNLLGGGQSYQSSYETYEQPRQLTPYQRLISQCPVGYDGRPARACVNYINQQLAARSTPRASAYNCPSSSGIPIVTRSYRPGCVPVDENGLYQGNGTW